MEESPKQIAVKQWLLWGISPKTAKKTMEIDVEPSDNGTEVKCISKLFSDRKNITLIGCVLETILVGYVYELLLILPLLCRQMFRVFGVGWLLRMEM